MKNEKKKATRGSRLRLTRQTIRTLQDRELVAVVGGLPIRTQAPKHTCNTVDPGGCPV
jgi:hypothetical protein